MLNAIFIFILAAFFSSIPIIAYPQTTHKTRVDAKKIISILKNENNKKELKKALSLFDKKSLEEILKNFNLLKQEETKEKLIESIIKNIPILVEKASEIDLPFFKRKEYTKKEQYKKDIAPLTYTNEFIVYKAAKLFFLNKKDKKGFRQIILFGKVDVKFAASNIEADLVVIKIDENEKPIEAFALGNILIKERQHRITGKKLYFFPNTSRALISSPIAYFTPFYFMADKGKRLEGNKYKFTSGIMTNDNVKNLHYKLAFKDAWYYSDEFVWANDVSYIVGDSTMFWSPLIFKSSVLTGVLTSLGKEDSTGWYTNNTLIFIPGETIKTTRQKRKTSIRGLPIGMIFKLDYYQRLGIYLGYELSFKIKDLSINIDTAIAYDRVLHYINGIFTNAIDIDNDNIPDETNNFRWTFKIDGDYKLFSASNTNMSIGANFETQSDPSFRKQFESNRSYQFDLLDLFNLFNKPNYGILSGGGYENQAIGFNLKSNIHKLRFYLKGDFDYALQFDPQNTRYPNKYDVSSYKHYKRSFTFPNMELSYSDYIQLIGRTKKKKKTKAEEEKENEYDKIFIDPKIPEETKIDKKEQDDKEKNKEDQEDEDIDYEDILYDVKTEEDFTVSLPINFSASTSIKEAITYNTSINKDNEIDYDIFSYNTKISTSIPFSIRYQFISFSINTNGNIYYTGRQTKIPDLQEKNDKELTYPSWNISASTSLKFNFFEEYKYLKLDLGTSVSYSKADRFTEPVKEGSTYKGLGGRSENINYSSYLQFFKTRLSVSFGDNLYINPYDKELIDNGIKSKEDILNDQKGNLYFSISSNPFNFIRISNSFSRSRKKEENISNSLSVSLVFNDIKIFRSFYISSLNLSSSWYSDFLNPIRDNLSISFQMQMSITKYWSFIYRISASNNSLYRYNTEYAKKYGKEKRDFFEDLLDSFNFFDTKARQRSFFKLNYLDFAINHDLHSWTLQFSLNFRFKEFKEGIYYFEPAIYVLLYLKDMPSIKYPTIEKVFTKQ